MRKRKPEERDDDGKRLVFLDEKCPCGQHGAYRTIAPSYKHAPVSDPEARVLKLINSSFLVDEDGDMTMYQLTVADTRMIVFSTLRNLLGTEQVDISGLGRGDGNHACYSAPVRLRSMIPNADTNAITKHRDGEWRFELTSPLRVLSDSDDGTIHVSPFDRACTDFVPWHTIKTGENPLVDFLATFSGCSASIPCREAGPPCGTSAKLFHVKDSHTGASALFVCNPVAIDFDDLGLRAPRYSVTHQPFPEGKWMACSGWYVPEWDAQSRVLIRELTGMPPCLIDIVSGFVGTWTVDFLLLLPDYVQTKHRSLLDIHASSGQGQTPIRYATVLDVELPPVEL